MAEDIATLGIGVNTAPVVKGHKDLDQFAASARRMAETVGNMDKTLGAFAASAKQMADSVARMERLMNANAAAARQTEQALAKADASARQFSAGMQRLGESAQRSQQQMHKVQEEAKKSADTMGGATVVAGRLGGTLAGIGAGITFGAVITKLDEVTKKLVDAQISADKLNNVFTFTTGSSAGAARELEFVRGTAQKLGQQVQSTAESYGKLSAAAKGSGMEGAALQRVFVGVSSAAAVMGLSAQETANAFRALEQMISKGKVSQEELRGQLSEAIPGATQIAARALGMTTSELGKFIEKGADAVDFVTAFGDQLEREFGGRAVEAANKMQGAVNRSATSWQEFWKAAANTGAADMIAKLLNATANQVDGITAALQRAQKEGKGFWVQMGIGIEELGKKLLNLNPLVAGFNALKPDKSVAGEMQKILDLDIKIQQLERSKPENNGFARQEIENLKAEQKALVDKYAAISNNAAAEAQYNAQLEKETKLMVSRAEVSARAERVRKQAAEDANDPAKLKKAAQERAAEQIAIAQGQADRQKAILDRDLAVLDHYHRMHKLSDEAFIQAKRDNALKQIAVQEELARKELAAQKLRGDLAGQQKQLAEIATLQERKARVVLDAEQAIEKGRYEIMARSNEEMNRYIGTLEQQAEALERENQAAIFSKAELEQQAAARMEVAIAASRQLFAEQALTGAGDEELALIKEKIRLLEQQRDAHLRIADALANKEAIEVSKKAADQSAQQWKTAYSQITDWITDGIASGFDKGEDIVKSFVIGLRRAFANLILQPIIAPIAALGASLFGGGGAGGMANGMVGGLQAGSMLQGFGSVGGNLGGLVSRFGETIGSQYLSNVGYGMQGYAGGTYGSAGVGLGNGLGAAANYAGGAGIGIYGGRAISGGYGIGGSGNGTVNMGTALGAAIAGPIGAAVGGILGGVANRLFGRKAPEMTSSGLQMSFDSTSGDVSGQTYQRYVAKGGLLRSDKRFTESQALDGGLAGGLQAEFQSIMTNVNSLGKVLGEGAKTILSFTANWDIAFQHTGDAAKDAAANAEILQKHLGETSDDLARSVIPGIERFQLMNESATQTLTRLAEEMKVTDQMLAAMGRTSQDAFGAVGLHSLEARESLIQLAGGLQNFASQVTFYLDNFMNEGEKLDLLRRQLAPELSKLGLSVNSTKGEFKSLVNSLDLSTDSGRQMFNQLMQVAPAFSQVADAAEAAQLALWRQAEEFRRRSLEATDMMLPDENRLAQLQVRVSTTLQSIGMANIKTQQDFVNALATTSFKDPARHKALVDLAPSFKAMLEMMASVGEQPAGIADTGEALRNLESVFRDVHKVLDDGRQRFDRFAESLLTFRDSLLTSDLSPLTPQQQYQTAAARFADVSARAKSGDENAMQELEAVSEDFLRLSRQMFASSEAYTADFNKVQVALTASSIVATQQSSLLGAQLRVLSEQAGTLIDVKKVLTNGFDITLGTSIYDRLDAVRKASEAIEKAIREVNGGSGTLPPNTGTPPPSSGSGTGGNPTPSVYAPASNGYWNPTEAVAFENANKTFTGGALPDMATMSKFMYSRSMGDSVDKAAFYASGLSEGSKASIVAQDPTGMILIHGPTGSRNIPLWEHIQQLIKSMQIRYGSLQQVKEFSDSFLALLNSSERSGASGVSTYDQRFRTVQAKFQNTPGWLKPIYQASAAVGLDYVPYDGFMARLHQGERVLRATEARKMDASQSIDFSRYGKGIDVSALCAEVRSLRAEVRSLRDDARQHAEATVRSNYDATDRAASKIVDGSKDAADRSAWRDKSKSSLS